MQNSKPEPPTIDYAAPPDFDEIPFVTQMLWWRSLCGNLFIVLVFTLLVGSILRVRHLAEPIFALTAIASWAGATLAAIMTIIYMGRAAAHEVGVAYAVRHIVLAVFLSIFLFIGVWWISGVVLSDLRKWRAVEAKPTPRE